MEKFRKYFAVGGTVLCALAIGFVMQFGQDVPTAQAPVQAAATPTLAPVVVETQPLDGAEATGPVETAAVDPSVDSTVTDMAPETAPDQPEVTSNDAGVALQDVALTAATPPANVPRALPPLPRATPARLNGPESAPADPDTPQLGCALLAQATETQMAMVRITVAAPCYPNERLTVHHNGMMFTETTDDTGGLVVDVPALTEHAIFILALSNGKGAVAQAHVPAIAGYDRVALQWSGDNGFQIHAREYGADYGDRGHVWSGSTPAFDGTSGFVTRLGDPDTFSPQVAEVYSFPTATATRPGTVTMSIEAEVSQANCGRDVSAQVLRLAPDHTMHTRDLILSVPGCDAIGDFLVLNNLVEDLKIAGN